MRGVIWDAEPDLAPMREAREPDAQRKLRGLEIEVVWLDELALGLETPLELPPPSGVNSPET